MKFKSITLSLLLLGSLFSSCIREDLSGCFSKNQLVMSYKGDGESEIFPEKICRVEMYVFDAENNCVSKTVVPQEQMDIRTAELPPLKRGEYTIVCVGNMHDTKVENIESGNFKEILLAAKDYTEGGKPIAGNDSLYFASIPYTVTGESQTKDLEFASSHYNILVEVSGIKGVEGHPELLPSIEVSGLLPYTDFENKACGKPSDYVLDYTHDKVTWMQTAEANIMRHTDHKNVNIYVRNSKGEILAEVNLAEFLAEHPKIDCSKQEVLIPIHFEFKSGEVSITVPVWWETPVKPEF